MMNCERIGSDCHIRLRDLWKHKTLLWLVFGHETWTLATLNTCNKHYTATIGQNGWHVTNPLASSTVETKMPCYIPRCKRHNWSLRVGKIIFLTQWKFGLFSRVAWSEQLWRSFPSLRYVC